MDFKKLLPSILTFANLSVGYIVVLLLANNNFRAAASLVIVAMVLDGLDGKLARKLQVSGDFGKELDSLCDIVSFGLVPAYFVWSIFSGESYFEVTIVAISTLFFLICGAYRLARFNVETSSSPGFTGIPITIAGGILALAAFYGSELNFLIIVLITIILALLMISEIPYPSFKGAILPNKTVYYIVFAAIIILFVFVPYLFLVVLILYLLSGIFRVAV